MSNELHLLGRLVASCEKLATALDGINETYRRQHAKQFPERKEIREAVLTHVPTEEEQLREAQQGSGGQTIAEWLAESLEGEEADDIGNREREWLSQQEKTP